MATYMQTILVTVLSVIALPAVAGHKGNRYPVPVYDNGQYDYAKVVNVEPVIEFVRVPHDQQICREVPVQRRVAEYRSPTPAIFGAIVGGIIGNQLSRNHGHKNSYRHGHHDNRVAATFAGAAIGGVIASEVQYSRYPARYYTENRRVCSIETSWYNEERIIAWDVSWKYRGRIYHSRMDERPEKRIRVRVGVDPVYYP